jgi:mono/diheme cytochrome c family protein
MKKFLAGVLATLVAGVVAAGTMVFGGYYNVAATEEHTWIGNWVLHTAMHQSVKARAGDVEVPDNLVSEERVRQGARAYDQLCAACHLKPGQTDSLIRQGLNPMPPTLDREGHWSAGEQFWIIKYGIRMTGMPAWGETHEDEDLWQLTAFLQRYPSLSEAQYAALVQPDSSGAGQAGDGHDHEHADMSGMTGSDTSNDDASTGTMSVHHDDADGHHSGEDGHHGQDDADHHQDESDKQAAPTEAASEEDDHYSDGHSH